MSADGSGDGSASAGSDDGGPGRRETAHRLFAAEFEDATHSYSESEEERAPNYVVAPSGARVNRVFAVGVLTETEPVSENVVRGRIVDPTGAFVVYAGQYQPDALAFLERTDPPAFVAVTGKARTFQPEDSDVTYTSIRPESLNEVDAETRDRWVVNAAERTRERIETMREAKGRHETGDELEAALGEEGIPAALAAGVPRALDAYGTTDDYLDALGDLSADAVAVVAGERDEAGTLDIAPDEGEDRSESASSGSVPESTVHVEKEVEEREGKVGDTVGTDATAGEPSAPEPASDPGETVEEETAGTGEFETPAAGNAEAAETEPDEPEPSADGTETPAEPASDSTESGTSPEPAESAATGTEATEPGASADEGGETGDATGEGQDGRGEDQDEKGEKSDEGEPTDELYEFDEEERQQVEEEHGLEFSTGDEVESAEELGEFESGFEEAGEGSEDESERAGAEEPTPAEESEPSGTASEAAEEAEATFDNPEAAAVEAMESLGGGEGVAREAVVEELVSRHGIGESEADEAIEEALMSGRCYESGDDELTPI